MDNNDQMILLMIKFIKYNFGMSRVKINRRFKRAIVIQEISYPLSNNSVKFVIQTKLTLILQKVFNCDVELAKLVINKALNI